MTTLWQAIRPYLILALPGSALLCPLLGADVPCTDDGGLYYYQAAATRHSLSQGIVFSRWLPDAALGYGVPLLNYREPLPRYLLTFLLVGASSLRRAANVSEIIERTSLQSCVNWGK